MNLPGWVNKKIVNGMVDILKDRQEKGTLPPEFGIYADNPKRIPSVRSIITAPDGFCIVESDYATAELRG